MIQCDECKLWRFDYIDKCGCDGTIKPHPSQVTNHEKEELISAFVGGYAFDWDEAERMATIILEHRA